MGTQINTRKVMQKGVDTTQTFQRGNITAKSFIKGEYLNRHETGRLPDFLVDQLNGRLVDGSVYVVYSYATPIGWCNWDESRKNRNWFIPDITYSVTTTHHQSLLRVMVDNPGFYLKFGHYSPEDTIVAKALIDEVMDETEL